MTWHDYALSRLSVFPREEVQAIVAYLEYKGNADQFGIEQPAIEAALQEFWRKRLSEAPTAAELAEHLAEEARYLKTSLAEWSRTLRAALER